MSNFLLPSPPSSSDELPLPPPPLLPHEDTSPAARIYSYHRHSGTPKSTHFDLEAELECLPTSNKITRRYSDESLVSNPAMLHTGTLISNYQDHPGINNMNSQISEQFRSGHATSTVKSNQVSPVKSPEPNRPAPVLKPQIGRKPSIDKALLAKKLQTDQQHVSRQPLPANGMCL